MCGLSWAKSITQLEAKARLLGTGAQNTKNSILKFNLSLRPLLLRAAPRTAFPRAPVNGRVGHPATQRCRVCRGVAYQAGVRRQLTLSLLQLFCASNATANQICPRFIDPSSHHGPTSSTSPALSPVRALMYHCLSIEASPNSRCTSDKAPPPALRTPVATARQQVELRWW